MAQGQNNARWTLWFLTAVGAVLVYQMLRPFAEAMAAGALLAVAFRAPHLRIRRHIHRPNLAATISTVAMILIFAGPLTVIVPILVQELRSGITLLQQASQPAGSSPLVEWLRRGLQQAGEWALHQGVTAVAAATGGIIQTFVTITTFYFLVRDGDALMEETVAVSPLGRQRTENLLHVAGDMIHASVYGVAAVALAQGVLCGIGVWIAGLPAPMLWGIATAAVSVIPFVGSALVWVPAVIVLFAKGSAGKAIFLLIWGAALVSMADNVVRPWILSSRVAIHPVLVMVSMLGAAQSFGIVGFVAGPVLLAMFLAILRALREEVAVADSPPGGLGSA